MALVLAQEKLYTINDIYSLPDGERAELIDGQIIYTKTYGLISGNWIYSLAAGFLIPLTKK